MLVVATQTPLFLFAVERLKETMKEVVYRGSVLAKGSTALEMWENWQREKSDRNAMQKKLDDHMKDVKKRHEELLERYK